MSPQEQHEREHIAFVLDALLAQCAIQARVEERAASTQRLQSIPREQRVAFGPYQVRADWLRRVS